MRNDRAIRSRAKKIKEVSCQMNGDEMDVYLVRKNKYATKTKQMAIWGMYYFTKLPIKIIASQVSHHHASVYHSTRVVNAMIETDSEFADMMLEFERKLVKRGMTKKNRSHNKGLLHEIDYPTQYKKKTVRFIPEPPIEKVMVTRKQELRVELKDLRERIQDEKDIDEVILLAKQIKDIEEELKRPSLCSK